VVKSYDIIQWYCGWIHFTWIFFILYFLWHKKHNIKMMWLKGLTLSIIVLTLTILIVHYTLEKKMFSCPYPYTLHDLQHDPIYHGMTVYFDDVIEPYSPYVFVKTRLNYHKNQLWQCRYYSQRTNSAVLISMPIPDQGLKPIGKWSQYDNEYACFEDNIEDCDVQKNLPSN